MYAIVRAYWCLFGAGFRRQSTYRLAALGGLAANATFGLLKVAVLSATVRAGGGELNGYDVGLISTYAWLSQGLLGSINLFGRSDAAERIKDGQIAIDFLRPVDVQAAAITAEVGQSVFTLIPRGVPSVLIGGAVVGLAMPTRPAPYVLGALSLLLGIVISSATVYIIAAAGFWLVETRGLQILYSVASSFLAGLFVPLALFPRWLQAVAHATPFPSMMMHPIDVISGRVDSERAVVLIALQCAWLCALGALGHLLTRRGQRRLEVQGG